MIEQLRNIAIGTTLLVVPSVSLGQESSDLDVRTDSTLVTDLDDGHTIESVIGIGKGGLYDSGRIPTSLHLTELIRIRNFFILDKGDSTHYTLLGARLNELDLAGIPTRATIFGSAGDIQGAGFETAHSLEDFILTLGADMRSNEDEAAHLGGGLEWQVNDQWRTEFGYDIKENGLSDRNQFLFANQFRLTPNDTLGLAYVNGRNLDGSVDNSLAGIYVHYGKDQEWGVRTFGKLDWNSEHNSRVIFGQVILAEEPTIGEGGATWFIGRNIRDDDSYQQSTIPLAINRPVVSLSDRATNGMSFLLEGALMDNSGVESGWLSGAIGYMESKIFGRDEIGGSLGLTHRFSDLTRDIYTVNTGLVYRKGKFSLDAAVSIPIRGDADPTLRLGLGWKF